MKKTLLIMATLFVAVGAWAQTVTKYSVTETKYTSSELNSKTEATYIAIKNLSATNNYYYVGNTGAAPYSKPDFSNDAVFIWEPAGDNQFYLKKLDGTYMQASSPKDFGSVDNAAKFITTNPTSTGTDSSNFNGDGDSQAYISGNDDPNLVRFVKGTNWINVQHGTSGTPTYNNGKGGWTIHYVYQLKAEEVQELNVVYNFQYEGKIVATQETVVFSGDEYPAVTCAFPYGYTAAKPEGKVNDEEAVDGVITKIIELTKTKDLPFVAATDFNSIEHWYYISIRDDGPTYLCYDSTKDYINASENSYSIENLDAYTWAFIGNPFDGFQIVNKAAGETMLLSAPAAPTGNKNAEELARMVAKEDATGNLVWIVKEPTHANAASEAFYIEHPTATSYAFNRQGHDGTNVLCYWTGRDTGSAIQAMERDMTGATELQTLVDKVKAAKGNYVAGTAPGYLTKASVDNVAAAVEAAEAYLAAGSATEEKSLEHMRAINAAVAALATVQPEEGKFYTVQNSYSNVFMGVGNTSGMVSSQTVGLGQVFQFVSAGEDIFYLYNVERGAYLNTNKAHQQGQEFAVAMVPDEAKPVKIANLGSENHVSITPIGGATLHHDAGQGTIVAWNGGLNSRSSWKIVEVDIDTNPHSVTITEAGWATLVLGCNATIPADVKAYVVSSASETSATLAEITGTIPANEAVLLNAAAGTYEFKYAAEATPVAENLLVGTVYDTNVELKAYVLSAQGEPVVVGFREAEFKVSTNTENDGAEGAEDDTFEAFKNNAFRAYLPAPAAGARFLSFDFGNETAIESIEGAGNAADAVIYDLAGRRVQKAQKGLYIVNGVKVIK